MMSKFSIDMLIRNLFTIERRLVAINPPRYAAEFRLLLK